MDHSCNPFTWLFCYRWIIGRNKWRLGCWGFKYWWISWRTFTDWWHSCVEALRNPLVWELTSLTLEIEICSALAVQWNGHHHVVLWRALIKLCGVTDYWEQEWKISWHTKRWRTFPWNIWLKVCR